MSTLRQIHQLFLARSTESAGEAQTHSFFGISIFTPLLTPPTVLVLAAGFGFGFGAGGFKNCADAFAIV